MVNGLTGNTTAIDRENGFEDTINEQCPNVEILARQPGNWNKDESQIAASEMITSVGAEKIDGAYAADDTMVAGVIDAFKARDMDPSELLITSIGNTELGNPLVDLRRARRHGLPVLVVGRRERRTHHLRGADREPVRAHRQVHARRQGHGRQRRGPGRGSPSGEPTADEPLTRAVARPPPGSRQQRQQRTAGWHWASRRSTTRWTPHDSRARRP